MEICHTFGVSDPIYVLAQNVRSDVSNQVAFDFDVHSHHYVLSTQGKPIGAISTQRATDGDLDCESVYPTILRREFQDKLYSTCKLRLRSSCMPSTAALRTIVRATWSHQLTLGSRICVINTTSRLRRFYQRIGFSEVSGFEFMHPILRTYSHVMLMTADPTHSSFCQDIFADVDDRISQSEMVAWCCHQSRLSVAG